VKGAPQALTFLLEKEQTCEDQDLFIIGYLVSIVSLLDQSEDFITEFKQMVQSAIKQDQLNDQDQEAVQLLVEQISQLS